MILPRYPLHPLTRLGTGRLVRVAEIEGGARVSRRLTEMGIRPGVVAEVFSGGHGPVILSLDGCRLALGRGMAKRVMVEALDGEPV